MKKIIIKSVNEVFYYEKLDNGLEVFMLPKQNVNNIYVTFNTKYGSMYNEFTPIGSNKTIKVPNGIAHFLEHKMFEQEDGIDPMLFYARSGADVNAFTTTHNTAYLFYGSEHFEENLNFLLDYVQKPYFTDENVEKEKGIIEQEIKMYEDDPYSVIEDGIRLNIFKNDPIRFPVTGLVEDIYSITKEQLFDCYHTFYHPSNMFLVITGRFDPEEVIEIVKSNQSKKEFKKSSKITIKQVNEPKEVNKKYEAKKMNVIIPKLSYGIKVATSKLAMDDKKLNFYLTILLDILFGSTSEFSERMKQLEYVDSSIAINKLSAPNYIMVALDCDTRKEPELIEEINKQLKKINISEEELERKKKLLISSELYLYENIRFINHYIVNNIILYNDFDHNVVQLIKSLNKTELDNLIKKLDFSNTSTLVIKSLEDA